MPRLSISFTESNDAWLKRQIDNKEYTSKSELINDLVRQARQQQQQLEWVRLRLESSEKSGFTNAAKEDILNESKARLDG
ncbi:MAG: type II toxin-antitoxin system ParD family antitoxin [Saprospiraceae bacterium]